MNYNFVIAVYQFIFCIYLAKGQSETTAVTETVTTTASETEETATAADVTTTALLSTFPAERQVNVSDISAAVGDRAKECFASKMERMGIMRMAIMSTLSGTLEQQSSKLQCTSKCVMQSYGVMDENGGMKPETIRKLVSMIGNPIIKQKALSRVDACIAEAKTITDNCQRSAHVIVCIARNGLAARLIKGLDASGAQQASGSATIDGNSTASPGVMGAINKAVGEQAKECFQNRLERVSIMRTAMKSIMKGNLEEESSKLQCTTKCVMLSFGVMDPNGGLQPAAIRKIAEKIPNFLVRKIALQRVDCCTEQAKVVTDLCQKSAFVVMCMVKDGLLRVTNAKEVLKSLPALLLGKSQTCTAA